MATRAEQIELYLAALRENGNALDSVQEGLGGLIAGFKSAFDIMRANGLTEAQLAPFAAEIALQQSKIGVVATAIIENTPAAEEPI